jgi:hypothetical protein
MRGGGGHAQSNRDLAHGRAEPTAGEVAPDEIEDNGLSGG